MTLCSSTLDPGVLAPRVPRKTAPKENTLSMRSWLSNQVTITPLNQNQLEHLQGLDITKTVWVFEAVFMGKWASLLIHLGPRPSHHLCLQRPGHMNHVTMIHRSFILTCCDQGQPSESSRNVLKLRPWKFNPMHPTRSQRCQNLLDTICLDCVGSMTLENISVPQVRCRPCSYKTYWQHCPMPLFNAMMLHEHLFKTQLKRCQDWSIGWLRFHYCLKKVAGFSGPLGSWPFHPFHLQLPWRHKSKTLSLRSFIQMCCGTCTPQSFHDSV